MRIKRLLVVFWILLAITFTVNSQSVVNTVHNLSISGSGPIKSKNESEVCIFCHTSHNSTPSGPLWNRRDPGSSYTLYSSSTLDAVPGQPDGSSILCLSCHDGTIALGNILNRQEAIDFGPISTIPVGKTNLSTDLRDDHVISFIYDATLSTNDGQLKDPSTILHPVSLEKSKLQCTSCHDPHTNVKSDFLVADQEYSQLCLSCHIRNYWSASTHATSSANWNGSGVDPWPHVPFLTVTENACENCHNPHNSGGVPRLMKAQQEESNCLDCHNGNVATTNIENQLAKPYSHNVYNYQGIHDPVEASISTKRHVECDDCHNGHAVNSSIAAAPAANGSLRGVIGVSQNGTTVSPVQYEYEVCYKCHAESIDKPASPTLRKIDQSNVRLEFDLTNPSFHPVTSVGKNGHVPSLISPMNESSMIYCSDCHASDGTSPGGPHGSIYPRILKYRYETADNTMESPAAYELCYSCHDRSNILGDNSFGRHDKHVRDKNIPCNACHDPHGIAASQGSSANNAHLINFDVNIVTPDGSGNLRYVSTGNNGGYCLLRCHGKTHDSEMDY